MVKKTAPETLWGVPVKDSCPTQGARHCENAALGVECSELMWLRVLKSVYHSHLAQLSSKCTLVNLTLCLILLTFGNIII